MRCIQNIKAKEKRLKFHDKEVTIIPGDKEPRKSASVGRDSCIGLDVRRGPATTTAVRFPLTAVDKLTHKTLSHIRHELNTKMWNIAAIHLQQVK